MRTHGQYCPIARAIEVVGERWTLLIVRDMLCGRSRFNDLARGLPGISRALLSKRLREMVTAGIATKDGDGYHLTPAGEDLRPIVFGLAEWGARHAFGDPRPEELDPEVLLWWISDRVDTRDVAKRAVVQVEIPDHKRRYWLVIEPDDSSVCYADPGFEVDAVLSGALAELYRMWSGEIDLLDALRQGRLELRGTRWVVQGLPRWLELSPAASYVQAARSA
jgi:DNA-binding HxlR family transcriptional regulator/putative sterol carrier protein